MAHFPVMKLSVIPEQDETEKMLENVMNALISTNTVFVLHPSAPFCHNVFQISAAFLKPGSDVRGDIVSESKKNPSPIP